MKRVLMMTAMGCCAMVTGCQQQPSTPKPLMHPPIHRFENISTTGETGVALDTVTGQWCKTWEWEYKNTNMSGGLDTLPTCVSLLLSYPAEVADPWSKAAQSQDWRVWNKK